MAAMLAATAPMALVTSIITVLRCGVAQWCQVFACPEIFSQHDVQMLFVAAQAIRPLGIVHKRRLCAVDEVHAVHSGFVVLSDLLWGLCVHDLLH